MGYECIFSSGSSNSRGVAILFSKGMEFQVHKHCSDTNWNYIIADISVEKNRLTLINLYGPNKDNPEFFENIMTIVETYNNNECILCGDFNLVQDPDVDYYNYKRVNNVRAQKKVLEIKDMHNLIDPFRECNPTLKRYTWRKKDHYKRLDLILSLYQKGYYHPLINVV